MNLNDVILSVAQIVPHTEAEGPGVRFALWFQGCPLRCPGCCNPEMLPFDGGTRMCSLFKAFGHWPDGFWLERSGAVSLALFGSTTQQVVRQAECPVLTVRGTDDVTP